MTKQLTTIKIDAPELQAVEKSKAAQIRATFEPMAAMLEDFESAYGQILTEAEKEITKDVTAKAKRLRLDIGKIRIEADKARKAQKEEYLRAGQAIDAVCRILTWAVKDKEDKLKGVEDHFEIMEQKRLEELQTSRAELLSPYVEDAHERNLSAMDEDVWAAYFSAKKKEHEDRIEAEKRAEAERIERERIEKLRWERSDIIRPYYDFFEETNVHLGKLSQEDFDKLLNDLKTKKAEFDAKIEAQRKENERLKKEREELAKKQEAERKKREEEARKEREEYERKLNIEAEQRAKAEAELKAKQEAEAKAEAEREAKLQSELSKGDAEKVVDLLDSLKSIKTKYEFKSAKNRKMYGEVGQLIDKIINHIQK